MPSVVDHFLLLPKFARRSISSCLRINGKSKTLRPLNLPRCQRPSVARAVPQNNRINMTTLAARDFAASPLEITGALDFDERGDALSPRRLPSWTRAQINPMLDFMLRTPSGVRIRFTTSAHTVSLTVLTTHMAARSGRGGCAFDLIYDDTVHTRRHHEGNQLHFDPTGQTAPASNPGRFMTSCSTDWETTANHCPCGCRTMHWSSYTRWLWKVEISSHQSHFDCIGYIMAVQSVIAWKLTSPPGPGRWLQLTQPV